MNLVLQFVIIIVSTENLHSGNFFERFFLKEIILKLTILKILPVREPYL
jgi:hypothetical protein